MKKFMRFTLILLLLASFDCKLYSQTKTTQPDEVYLLIGQSNMSGRGKVEDTMPVVSDKILMLDKTNNWVIAKDPLHFDKDIAGVGPGLSFAKAMLKKHKKTKIGLIPCAWGGSPIKVWVSGATYLEHKPYDEAIARAKVAMQSGKLKGILWHQGESDNNVENSKVYLQKLEELVANLRKDLNAPDVPFVAGEIGRFNKDIVINAIIDSIPKVVTNSGVVSSEGLVDRGDHLHFNTASAHELGERYAVVMKKLQKKLKRKHE